MASIYGAKSSTGWQLRLDYTYTQDVKANSSNISMSLYIYDATGESYNQAANSCYYVLQGTKVYHPYSYSSSGWYKLGSDTLTVMHDSDGTKSVRLYGSWYSGFSSSYTPSSLSVASTITLTPIPRASSVSCTTANIGSDATITISKASSNFTHTLTYAFGSLHGTIATKTSSANVNFTLPTTFYAQIPNAQSGWGTITCDTYNGSTLVGTSNCTFTARCDESQCKPTISGTAIDSNATTVALTGNSSKFIKYYSNASVATGAQARNSATLKSQKITCGSKSLTSADGTINAVESGTFTFSATDSRGYTTTQTVNKTLIDYIKLTCSMEAGAPTTGGVATLKIRGNYWDGSFGKVANTLTVQYRYKTQGGSYGSWIDVTATKSGNTYNATATISGLNYQTAYVFQARAVDKLATINTDEQARRTTPIFDWSKNDFNINGSLKVNGATTITGTANITGTTTVDGALNTQSLKINNTEIDYIVSQGTSGDWIYRKWNSGVAECWCLHRDSNVSISSAWGNLFESARMGGLTYPSGLFNSTPVCTVQVQNSSKGAVLSLEITGNNASATATPYWAYTRATSATGTNITVGVHAVGKWK